MDTWYPSERMRVLCENIHALAHNISSRMEERKVIGGFKKAVIKEDLTPLQDIFLNRKMIGLFLAARLEHGYRELADMQTGIRLVSETEFIATQKVYLGYLQTLLALFSLIKHYTAGKDVVGLSLADCGLTVSQLDAYWKKAKEKMPPDQQRMFPPPHKT